MNEKLCKALRVMAFNNIPSSEERKKRLWNLYEDKKQNKLLRCGGVRATYKEIKKLYKNLSGWYRIIYTRDIKAEARKKKHEANFTNNLLYRSSENLKTP